MLQTDLASKSTLFPSKNDVVASQIDQGEKKEIQITATRKIVLSLQKYIGEHEATRENGALAAAISLITATTIRPIINIITYIHTYFAFLDLYIKLFAVLNYIYIICMHFFALVLEPLLYNTFV